MSTTFRVIILAWLSLSKTVTASLVNCPPTTEGNVLIPHQFECSAFFLCDNTSLKPSFLLRCPSGLYFNTQDKSGGCMLADRTTCEPSVRVRQVNTYGREGRNVPERTDQSYRNYTTHLPNPDNCSQFYRYESMNEPTLYECPNNLHFDPNLEVCETSEESSCQSTISTRSSLGGSPDLQRDCNDISEPACPAGNTRLVHLPHPTNCGDFYKCNWGTPILFHCPDGLHFNPIIQVCDWPRNVNCNPCQIQLESDQNLEQSDIQQAYE